MVDEDISRSAHIGVASVEGVGDVSRLKQGDIVEGVSHARGEGSAKVRGRSLQTCALRAAGGENVDAGEVDIGAGHVPIERVDLCGKVDCLGLRLGFHAHALCGGGKIVKGGTAL